MQNSGNFFEDYLREVFDLKRIDMYNHIKPDILDPKKGIIGEVKSARVNKLTDNASIVIYTNQINRYKKLKDSLNKQTIFEDGAVRKRFYNLHYFIIFFKEYEDGLNLKTFVLGETDLSKLLSAYKPQKTRWALKGRCLNHVELLSDKFQEILYGERDDVMKRVVQKNKEGSYIRPKMKVLSDVCENKTFFGTDFNGFDISNEIYFHS